MLPLTPRSCKSRLNSSRTASPPLAAQDPLGFPGSRRLVQTKTCLSKCGSAMVESGEYSVPRLQRPNLGGVDPAFEPVAEPDAQPVLVALDHPNAQPGV